MTTQIMMLLNVHRPIVIYVNWPYMTLLVSNNVFAWFIAKVLMSLYALLLVSDGLVSLLSRKSCLCLGIGRFKLET